MMNTAINVTVEATPDRSPTPRVLSVGQCGFDHRSLSGFLKRAFGAETVAVGTLGEAIRAVRVDAYSLVLVNRVLDSDGSPGLELVRALKSHEEPRIAGTPVMLVSNYVEARRQAEAIGALPGFGKADLSPSNVELLARLRTVLG